MTTMRFPNTNNKQDGAFETCDTRIGDKPQCDLSDQLSINLSGGLGRLGYTPKQVTMAPRWAQQSWRQRAEKAMS